MYTNITDSGLAYLKRLEKLSSLNLTSTKVTQAGVDQLRRDRPGLHVEYVVGNGFVIPTRPAAGVGGIPSVPARP